MDCTTKWLKNLFGYGVSTLFLHFTYGIDLVICLHDMNLESLFCNFNAGKFIVWLCLAIFTALLALRLDEFIDWSYWLVFTPIWIWKILVILGAFIGNIVWWKNPHFRLEGQSYIQYRALLISLGLHLFLLMFEVLLADNLENHRHAWVSVFAPLIFISIVSIAACIWAVKHDRSFELELFCSVNLLQFIFIALRLDNYTGWPWEVVLVPAWILMCVSIVAVLYSIIFAGLLLRMGDVHPDRRRNSMNSAVGYTCLVAPVVVFLIKAHIFLFNSQLNIQADNVSMGLSLSLILANVTLSSKLNGTAITTYSAVVAPLYLSYLTLILMSFTTKRANQWWFGLRKDLCQFLLGVCPLLQEYANISYSVNNVIERRSRSSTESAVSIQPEKQDISQVSRRPEMRVVAPAFSLEVPD